MWRKLRKITIWTLSIFVGIVLTLAFVIWLMQDKIKAYAIDYLNQHLKTELKVAELNVTFLSTFPKVTLHFNQVTILDPPGLQSYRDTLLSARNIYLKFNLWDVLASEYKPHQLDVYDAHLRAFINEEGKENYDIVKPQPTTEKKSKLELDLKKVKLYNTRLTYHNAHGNQRYKFKTQELELNGKITDAQFDLKTRGDLKIIGLYNKNLAMFKNQDSELDLTLGVNTQKNTIEFKNSSWKIGKMHLGIKGGLEMKEEGTQCNVDVYGKNISLVSIMQMLPDKVRANISKYKSFGNINLEAGIKGLAGKTMAPDVKAKFDITNGILIERKSDVSLHNIDLEGSYTNKNKLGVDELNFTKAHARFKDGKFDLQGKLTDFNKPHFVFTVTGDFGLATLHDFMDPETVKDMKGEVHLNSKLDFVLLRTDELLLPNAIVNEASGEVVFKEATVLIREGGKPITDFNGVLNLKDNDALVDNLRGKIGATDFVINGAIKNFTPYILSSNQDLSIVGALRSSYCNIDDFVQPSTEQAPNQKTGENTSSGFHFPKGINFNVDMDLTKLEWKTFTAQNVGGKFMLVDQKLQATDLRIDLAGGKCTGNVTVAENGEQGFLAKSTTQIAQVQLPLLLKAFDNFGQELLTPQNAKGVLSAHVECVFPLDANLKVDAYKMFTQANVSIVKGELNELDQLKKLAEFMRTDKKLKLFVGKHADDFEKRVKRLKFDELKNELTVKEGVLTIPKMEINSSAMKVNFAGTHAFNNTIDYHFNFRFLELKEAHQSEFGEIKDDGTGLKLYIRMHGDLDNPSYSWDKEEKKAEKQEQWQQEKENLKSILKEEFNLFKRDTTVKSNNTKQEDVKFIIEWDEEKPDPNAKPEQQDNKKVKKIKKKLGIDENEKKDVKFDIEQ